MAGWIDHFNLQCVYERARQSWALDRIRASSGHAGIGVSLTASLVGFQVRYSLAPSSLSRVSRSFSLALSVPQSGVLSLLERLPFSLSLSHPCARARAQGGQWLMSSVSWINEGFVRETVDCFALGACDHEHGDDLDLPPNGLASRASLERAPLFLTGTIEILQDAGVDVSGVTACQGLVEHSDMLEQHLRAHESTRAIFVVQATSTAASESHGIATGGPGGLLGDVLGGMMANSMANWQL